MCPYQLCLVALQRADLNPALFNTRRDGTNLECRHTLEGHQLGVVSADVDVTGTLAASSSIDSEIRLWDLASGNCNHVINAGPVNTWTVAFSPDSRLIASGSNTGEVNLFSVESGKRETGLKTLGQFTMSVAYVRCHCGPCLAIAATAHQCS